jgi:PAS domain S-box-containing protein
MLKTDVQAVPIRPGSDGESHALHRARQRYAALSKATAQVVVVAGPEGGLLDEQKQWEEFTGQSSEAHRDFGWLNAVHPEDRERTSFNWRRSISQPLGFQNEFRLRRNDGVYRWFLMRATPILEEDGSIHEWLAVYSDVTDRNEATWETNRALSELNDLKAAIDEHAIVAITDPKGKITYVNDKFCAISRYSRQELLGQDHRIINSGYHPKQFIRGIWESISRGQVWKGEIKNKAKDGTFYWVDTTIVPYLDPSGKPIQYIAIRADITERKRAEEQTQKALRELNDVRAAIDEHAIVAITDQKGKITYVNDKFCAISKYSRQELIGQDHRIINSGYHPKEFIRSIWQTIGNGRVWKGQIKNRAKDGTYYWVDTTIVPYLGEDGKPVQYIAIRADITDRKRADEQTAHALRELNDVKAAIDQHAIVAITDPRGKITYVNDKFCAISKYAREELIGQDHRIINSGFHSKEFIRSIWQTIGNGRVWKGEIKNRAKDGTHYWVDTTIVPYLGEDGKPVQYIAIRADITDRKRADEQTGNALRELNDVKAAIDQHAIVAITDSRGKINYVNDKFCAISKYSRDELMGQDHRIINSGYHSKDFIRNIWVTIGSGRVWKGEIRNRAKDGTHYWVDTTIVPYLGEDGKPKQYIAIRADITDRKRSDEQTSHALRELSEVKAAIDEHAIVAITDPRGKITYVNDKFCAISKYSREELLGQDHRIINSGYHPKQFIRSIWQTIGSGRVWKGEIKNKAKDGTFYWVDTTIVPYLGDDGKPVQYIAIRADITDRKRADEQTAHALRELNDVRAALDEHAIVAITDSRGKINYVNDKFCAISKYSREELIGQDHRIINSGHHPKTFIRNLWQTIGSGRVWKGEIQNRAKDGTYYWVDTTIVPYLGEDGKPLQYIAIRADITERKLAEAALQKAQGELQEHATTLEQTVDTRTAALRETIGELEAFSYSVSHDMRAPLRAMQSFSKILAEDFGGRLPAQGLDYLRRISTAAARMDALIQDVLTYSRVARTELPLQPIELGGLLREIVETYPMFQAPSAKIEFAGEFPIVYAIPAVLTQCVSNLLGNAVKFMEPGVTPQVRIWLTDPGPGLRYKLFIKDNGLGIDREEHDKIWGIFQRVNKSYEGTGIGLSIVKKGAERMGGAAGLESTPGKGSTFWLELQKQPLTTNDAKS